MIQLYHQIILQDLEKIFLNKYYDQIMINIMTIYDQIENEKLQYDTNRQAVKISALSSGKIA